MSVLANEQVTPFWVNVPFLLTQPMGFFVWTIPVWLVVTVAFVSLFVVSVTTESWELEKRLIPIAVESAPLERFFWPIALRLALGRSLGIFARQLHRQSSAFSLRIKVAL